MECVSLNFKFRLHKSTLLDFILKVDYAVRVSMLKLKWTQQNICVSNVENHWKVLSHINDKTRVKSLGMNYIFIDRPYTYVSIIRRNKAKARLDLTLLWYSPCYFTNLNYSVIMLTSYYHDIVSPDLVFMTRLGSISKNYEMDYCVLVCWRQ